MPNRDDEEELLRSVALQNAQSILLTRRRAEEALRKQAAWLQVTLSSIGDGVISADVDGLITFMNGVAEALTGWPEAEALGRPLSEVFHIVNEHSRQPVENPALRALKEETIVGLSNSTVLVARDGVERPIDDCGAPIRDEHGNVAGCVLIFRDITPRKHAEQSLRESEERFRMLAESIPQLTWMARPDGHIYWYNRRWYEYTGTTPEEMTGWGWQSVHDPDELPKVMERWKQSLATGDPFDMVFPLRGADGLLRPFLTRVLPQRAADGKILQWFGTNTDVSELKEAREALAGSEKRLRLALAAGHMGVWDWNIRTNQIKWSDSLEALHGLKPGTFGGTLEDVQKLIHPDDREMVNNAIRRSIESRVEYDVEFRNVWPNGSIHWTAGKGMVFHDDNGRPERMIGICMDVTQRKRSEQAARFLADASATLGALVDFDSTLQKVASLAVPYFADWATVDLAENDGSLRRVAVAHVDPEKISLAHELHRRFPLDPKATHGAWHILRTGQSEIVPRISDELLAESIKDEELLGILRELGLKSYIGTPLKVRGKTLGVVTFIAAESGHIYDEHDLAVAQDLADRAAIAIENTQLYRDLRDADRRKDEFLATLAHELRNPLAPIRNSLQILKMSHVDAETSEKIREMIERQVHYLERLVDDLLDVSRVMRGKIELRKEQVQLASVIARAVETAQPLIEAQGHQLEISLPRESLLVDADPVRLIQVLGNLLTNSAKYTEPNGRIWLSAKREGTEAVLTVRDTGIGISQEMLPHVFELFVQVDHAAARSQGGLGIGLTLVKNLVEMHHGSIAAHSAGLGKGCEFVVRLPLLSHELEIPPEQKSGPRQHREPSGHRLLVVDDNRDAATTLAMLLRLQGHEVQVVYDGLAALEIAASSRIDMVFLDIGMPGMDGYEVARRFRKTPGLENTILAALTGWGQHEDRRRTAEAGFDYHLVKPTEPKALEALLTDLKQRKQAASIARRILVVEDNVGAAKVLSMLIGKTGPHEVQMAHDGPSALETAAMFHPDIVLLDIGLPKMDGHTVARKLREMPVGQNLLLVALTGHGEDDDRKKTREAGFDEHFTKPVGIDTLRKLLCHPKLNS